MSRSNAMESHHQDHSIALIAHDLSWELPDGKPLFSHLSFALGQERVGLIGPNGAGKTTLLELLLGLRPLLTGAVERPPRLGYLPQSFEVHGQQTIAGVLGVEARLAALRKLNDGAYDSALLELIGNDWGLEERTTALLERFGLGHLELDRRLSTLSGGETTRVVLASRVIDQPDFLILDEPTNNLDQGSREALYDLMEEWPGGLLVVSHDRALLGRVDRILELNGGTLRSYGGNFEDFVEQRAQEDETARRQLGAAEASLRRQRRDAQTVRERQAKRLARGAKSRERQDQPRILLGAMKRRAQQTTAKLEGVHATRVDGASSRLAEARAKIRPQNVIQIDLERTEVPSGRLVVRMQGVTFGWPGTEQPLLEGVDLELTGPARVALLGPNGAGKTTLVRLLLGELEPLSGEVRGGVERVAWLDQRARLLDPAASILENFERHSPLMEPQLRRLRLGRFLFKADRVMQPVSSLSGGERMRAALACLLAGDRPPQLLVLDEPTNNLDLDSIEQLESALDNYRGALLVISHDQRFLRNLGIGLELRIG